MEQFQQTVIIVSIIILLLVLAVIGILLYRAKYSQQFPPVLPNCPDYWLDNSTGDASSCYNTLNLGVKSSSCSQTMDFSTAAYAGKPGMCKKKKWANDCNITWDGISNNDKLKCN